MQEETKSPSILHCSATVHPRHTSKDPQEDPKQTLGEDKYSPCKETNLAPMYNSHVSTGTLPAAIMVTPIKQNANVSGNQHSGR